MAWLYLFLAGLAEVAWVIGLKQSDGWSKLGPSLFTGTVMVVSFVLLSRALRELPIGTAYAVWTGIGAVGAALIGMAFFGESRAAARLFFIAVIVAGIVGLKLSAPET